MHAICICRFYNNDVLLKSNWKNMYINTIDFDQGAWCSCVHGFFFFVNPHEWHISNRCAFRMKCSIMYEEMIGYKTKQNENFLWNYYCNFRFRPSKTFVDIKQKSSETDHHRKLRSIGSAICISCMAVHGKGHDKTDS